MLREITEIVREITREMAEMTREMTREMTTSSDSLWEQGLSVGQHAASEHAEHSLSEERVAASDVAVHPTTVICVLGVRRFVNTLHDMHMLMHTCTCMSAKTPRAAS